MQEIIGIIDGLVRNYEMVKGVEHLMNRKKVVGMCSHCETEMVARRRTARVRRTTRSIMPRCFSLRGRTTGRNSLWSLIFLETKVVIRSDEKKDRGTVSGG